jgi:hypothetical protein
MPREVDGTFNLVPGNPVDGGTQITATWANSTLSDMGDALTQSLDRFGNGGMEAQLFYLAGTEGAPGASFTNDPNTGMFLAGIGDLQFSATSSAQFRVTSAGAFVRDGGAWVSVVGAGTAESVPAGTADFQTLAWNSSLTEWEATSTLQVSDSLGAVGIGLDANPFALLAVGGDTWIGTGDGLVGISVTNFGSATYITLSNSTTLNDAICTIGIVGTEVTGEQGVVLSAYEASNVELTAATGDIVLTGGTSTFTLGSDSVVLNSTGKLELDADSTNDMTLTVDSGEFSISRTAGGSINMGTEGNIGINQPPSSTAFFDITAGNLAGGLQDLVFRVKNQLDEGLFVLQEDGDLAFPLLPSLGTTASKPNLYMSPSGGLRISTNLHSGTFEAALDTAGVDYDDAVAAIAALIP